MINHDYLEDAMTHGVYLSEVEDEVKAAYCAFLRSYNREDLIDIPVGAE